MLAAGGQHQYLYQNPSRGYMSSMDDRAHFGLGAAQRVDSLEVIWPDGRRQVLTNLGVDRLLIVRQRDASGNASPLPLPPSPAFAPLDPQRSIAYRQRLSNFVDYDV